MSTLAQSAGGDKPRAAQLAEARRVSRQAVLVAHECPTEQHAKKYGAWLIYRDDRLVIRTDTFAPVTSVKLADGRLVLTVHLGEVGLFRPGAWVAYLDTLAGQAARNRAAREAACNERQAAAVAERWSPVDDAALFAAEEDQA